MSLRKIVILIIGLGTYLKPSKEMIAGSCMYHCVRRCNYNTKVAHIDLGELAKGQISMTYILFQPYLTPNNNCCEERKMLSRPWGICNFQFYIGVRNGAIFILKIKIIVMRFTNASWKYLTTVANGTLGFYFNPSSILAGSVHDWWKFSLGKSSKL